MFIKLLYACPALLPLPRKWMRQTGSAKLVSSKDRSEGCDLLGPAESFFFLFRLRGRRHSLPHRNDAMPITRCARLAVSSLRLSVSASLQRCLSVSVYLSAPLSLCLRLRLRLLGNRESNTEWAARSAKPQAAVGPRRRWFARVWVQL